MAVADVNRITLDSYDSAPEQYEARTPRVVEGAFKDWLDTALAQVPSGASILEIGSGTGRDARYMEQAGYSVHRTEASEGMRSHLASQGPEVATLNVLTDKIPNGFDMIFANAVIHHFDAVQADQAMRKVFRALGAGGVFAFSVKEGEREEWEAEKLGHPRFFHRWSRGKLDPALRIIGFEVVEMRGGVRTSNGEHFVQAIARRP